MSTGTKSVPDRPNTALMRDCRCPFMEEIRGKTIQCEGPMGDVSVVLKFRTARKMEMHAATYCKDKYDYCEVCRMVMAAKYED